MPLVTAQGISRLMIPLLRRTLVLPNTVARPAGNEFAGDNGDTITVRVRQPRTANVQAVPGASIAANIDPINEVGVAVVLHHLYDAASITDEELSMELIDFGMQVTEPQVAAVAAGAEDELAVAMNAVVADHVDLTSANVEAYILEAREVLSEADVPPGDRFCACSPAGASLVLGIDNFQDNVARTGDDSALREAVIGRYSGFTFVESNALDGGALDQVLNFYHRSGWAFANRAPVAPRGANQSASVSDSGLGLRQIFQYDTTTLSDQSVISTFAGASLVDANRTFKVEDAP
jgi:hypothetical protein